MKNVKAKCATFSHPSEGAGEDVFERLQKALGDLASYIPMARQNPFWKARVMKYLCLGWEEWAFTNGWLDDFSFPAIEDCFESVLQELGIVAQAALLDPRLQIEAVPVDPDVTVEGDGCPSWAFPVHRHQWIKEFVEVRPATTVLLVLFQPDIVHLPEEEVMEDLRHEFGHAFLYLRDPDAKDDCAAADEEWKRCTQNP
ncbi:MAG: hypothetical protein ABSF97_01725 [Candidatus Sulfotelmatobacter sp.]|jgi:hypothetical protein